MVWFESAGHRVLINGASSGVGTFALQKAKAYDTEVTAAVDTRNVEIALSEGRRILKPGGVCVLAGTGSAAVQRDQPWRIARTSGARFLSRFSYQTFAGYRTRTSEADLKFLGQLIAAGRITMFVEKSYRFARQ